MPTYYAVFKRFGETIGSSCTYEERDVPDAIAGMCEKAGVIGTQQLSEFQILEVAGRNYILRASKGERKMRPTKKESLPVVTPPSIRAPTSPPVVAETKYVPYTRSTI